jgi:hypothetical protein
MVHQNDPSQRVESWLFEIDPDLQIRSEVDFVRKSNILRRSIGRTVDCIADLN